MYQEKMVVCLKNNGKILREKEGIIQIPFGSEYSIYIKNMESRKAKVKISIDGVDVLNGQSLLINPNETTELEGFLNDCIAKNKFKFIPKTKEISEYRGDKIEDGLIRVEFWYEKLKPITQHINQVFNPNPNPWWVTYKQPTYDISPTWTTNTNLNCSNSTNIVNKSMQMDCLRSFDNNVCQTSLTSNCSTSDITAQNCSSLNSIKSFDDGITVKGEEISQQFKYGNIGVLEENSHVIILRLVGFNDIGDKVEKVVTVRDKLQCRICGKVSGSSGKFCDRCGSYLE